MATSVEPQQAAASGLKALLSHPVDDKEAVIATITVVDPSATKASQVLVKEALGAVKAELASAPAKPVPSTAANSAEVKADLKTDLKADVKAEPQPAEYLGGDIETKISKVGCGRTSHRPVV